MIHAAPACVSQAATQLAQLEVFEQFAIVGGLEKHVFPQEKYGLPNSHISLNLGITYKCGVIRIKYVINGIFGRMFQFTLGMHSISRTLR